MQVALVMIEVVVLARARGRRAGQGRQRRRAALATSTPSWSWFNPCKLGSFSMFMQGMLLMVFIYWGWDTTISINEETDEPGRIPGIAGVSRPSCCSGPICW